MITDGYLNVIFRLFCFIVVFLKFQPSTLSLDLSVDLKNPIDLYKLLMSIASINHIDTHSSEISNLIPMLFIAHLK